MNNVEKPKISPLFFVVGGVILISGLMLLMPSSRTSRIIKAKEYLAREFPIASEEAIKPLLGSHLVTDDAFIYDTSQKECAILVFTPDSTSPYSADSMMSEINRPLQSYGLSNVNWEKVPVVVLLAPDETSTGWTIFSKIWIAKILQKQRVNDLKQLGLELTSSPAALARVKKIWAKQPAKIQARAAEILEENRKIAKPYRKTPRFYRNKVTFTISNQHDMSEFIGAYIAGNPEKFPDSSR